MGNLNPNPQLCLCTCVDGGVGREARIARGHVAGGGVGRIAAWRVPRGVPCNRMQNVSKKSLKACKKVAKVLEK